MSTVAICYPNTIRERTASNMGLILILMSLALIAGAILVIVVSANAARMDQAPVAQHSIMAVPVPTPPSSEIQPASTGTPALFSGPTSAPSVVAVPVPTP
jgi:hypothetical protein